VLRLALAALCALLMLSLSGVTAVAIGEQCSAFEQTTSSSDHGNCAPTCVTCGCCAQAVEPTAAHVEATPQRAPVEPPPLTVQLPAASPLDVLHVPRPRLVS
jgi:hypothetical protein